MKILTCVHQFRWKDAGEIWKDSVDFGDFSWMSAWKFEVG